MAARKKAAKADASKKGAGNELAEKLRAKNAHLLMALADMDRGFSPTEFQRSTVPDAYRANVSVVFDGIDTAVVKPDPAAKKADATGQPSPQGNPGQLETDNAKGSYPSSPQGGTPNAMQVKPKGEDQDDKK